MDFEEKLRCLAALFRLFNIEKKTFSMDSSRTYFKEKSTSFVFLGTNKIKDFLELNEHSKHLKKMDRIHELSEQIEENLKKISSSSEWLKNNNTKMMRKFDFQIQQLSKLNFDTEEL